MPKIIINQQSVHIPEGQSLKQIVSQLDLSSPALAAIVNKKVQDLSVVPKEGDIVETLDYTTRTGFMAYQRTTLMMLFCAASEILPDIPLIVEFALGDGLFIRRLDDMPLSVDEVHRLNETMRKLQQQHLPLHGSLKSPTPDTIPSAAYLPAEILLPSYTLQDTTLCLYSPMTPHTGYIDTFALHPYDDGLLLRIPRRQSPGVIPPFSDQTTQKLYQTLRQTSRWANRLKIRTVPDLDKAIIDGRSSELILIAEALQEKRIAQIAESIAKDPDIGAVLIAGPSSSGKTSFANRLSIQLKAIGLKPLMLSVDNYFVDRNKSPRNPDGSFNFDTLDAIDLNSLQKDVSALLNHKPVRLPSYNFVAGKREYPNQATRLDDQGIIVMEGIFCLNDHLIDTLPCSKTYKIYVSALGQINLDAYNYIRSTDGRMLRRMVRDNRTRGISPEKTMLSWDSVRAGEEQNIFPYQNNADVMFNTSALYEWAVLKKYAVPLLYQIPETSPAYPEARRLLRLLDHLISIDNDLIPKNSLVREFIGGSCFNV